MFAVHYAPGFMATDLYRDRTTEVDSNFPAISPTLIFGILCTFRS